MTFDRDTIMKGSCFVFAQEKITSLMFCLQFSQYLIIIWWSILQAEIGQRFFKKKKTFISNCTENLSIIAYLMKIYFPPNKNEEMESKCIFILTYLMATVERVRCTFKPHVLMVFLFSFLFFFFFFLKITCFVSHFFHIF